MPTMTATRKTLLTETRIARITEAYKAWGIEIASVVQPMPRSAAKWFRVNVQDFQEMDTAKAVAEAVGSQYGLQIVVVCW